MDWEQILDSVKEYGAEYGPPIIFAILTFIVGRWVARILRGVLRRALRRAKTDEMLIGFLSSMAYIVLMLLVVISALDQLGVATAQFAALIAAAGLAIGFALQGSLSNFAAGVMIILFRPFKLGDFVEAGGATGSVVEILIFNTVIKTSDNRKVIVPNGSMMGGNIVNYSAFHTRRVDLVAGIGYGDDVVSAKRLFEKILADHPLVLDEPAPAVALIELADSSVNFAVRPWCKGSDYGKVKSEVTEQIKLECDKAGINIPYPQQDVHMHRVDAA